MLGRDKITDGNRWRKVRDTPVVTGEVVQSAGDAEHGNIMHAGRDVLIDRTV